MNDKSFEIIVIGAGHAGCEAGLAAARLGVRTAVFCTDLESVAMMPCNPSIGGTGKGHLVREVDALGGEMGVNIDKTFIQSKMLNTSKGPAVHSLRAQADKHRYHEEMLKTLQNQENLELIEAEIVDVCLGERGEVCGVVSSNEETYEAKAVIVCTGTFLAGRIFIGDEVYESGPDGLSPATRLGENLRAKGLPMRRFKTGTPARMTAESLNYEAMQEQKGDERIVPFSFLNEDKEYDIDQISCWLSYTNEETHGIIMDNIERSAMYSGNIVGVGPRYCPSIEDKVSRFRDRARHQLFVEPEGLDTNLMYIQGMSSSLPRDVQEKFYSTIPGLENAEIVKHAYAIEYDCIDPLSLKPSLENKAIENLFCAGQFNGSSGYEEAASQGLIAGINAECKLRGREPLVLRRDQAYIGVLIDDLVTKGTNEPYRIMTSRAEYRLLLRQDNADRRLTEIGREYGLVTDERYDRYLKKKDKVDAEVERLRNKRVDISTFRKFLADCGELQADTASNQTFAEILARPAIRYADLAAIDDDERPTLGLNEMTEVEVVLKYDGYIRKQINEVEKLQSLENKRLGESLDYNSIGGLRLEARQKLSEIRPRTVGQASRISGVSPADINVLLVYLEKMSRENREKND